MTSFLVFLRRHNDRQSNNRIRTYNRYVDSNGGGIMTIQQLLLIQLSEELSEVQQSIAKALRFGIDDGYPNRTICSK